LVLVQELQDKDCEYVGEFVEGLKMYITDCAFR